MKAMKTVLFFLRTLASGGVEAHLLQLGRGLMAAGFNIMLVSDGRRNVKEYNFDLFAKAGFACHKVTFPGPSLGTEAVKEAAISAWQVNSLVRSVQPDMIHVHYRVTSGYAQAMQVL